MIQIFAAGIKKGAGEIGEIVDRIPGWERLKYPFSCGAYGSQRGWVKTSETTAGELPICNKV